MGDKAFLMVHVGQGDGGTLVESCGTLVPGNHEVSDVLESFIIALAFEGFEVGSSEFQRAVNTALEAMDNNL